LGIKNLAFKSYSLRFAIDHYMLPMQWLSNRGVPALFWPISREFGGVLPHHWGMAGLS